MDLLSIGLKEIPDKVFSITVLLMY